QVAMQQGASGDHLRVQPGVRRQQAMKVAAMPVRPVQHRGNGETARGQWGDREGCRHGADCTGEAARMLSETLSRPRFKGCPGCHQAVMATSANSFAVCTSNLRITVKNGGVSCYCLDS